MFWNHVGLGLERAAQVDCREVLVVVAGVVVVDGRLAAALVLGEMHGQEVVESCLVPRDLILLPIPAQL